MAGRPLLIVGAGAHGRAVLELAHLLDMAVAGFIDDMHPIGAVVDGVQVLGTTSLLDDKGFMEKFLGIVAIGNSIARRRFSNRIRAHGQEPAILVHPSVRIPESARIGTGSVLVGENVVYPGVVIGQDVLIDPGVTFGIENQLADGVYMCPGCHLGAYVTLREESFLGMGAVVVPERTIGRRAVVGAGAVVFKDVPDGKLVFGNPGRVTGDAILDDWSPYPARSRESKTRVTPGSGQP
jgi:sugar O-acyltransferase (sialic acid O-acetyltransferase NeuD family)